MESHVLFYTLLFLSPLPVTPKVLKEWLENFLLHFVSIMYLLIHMSLE